jgi:hypothetical protein
VKKNIKIYMKREITIQVCSLVAAVILFILCTIARLMDLPWLPKAELIFCLSISVISIRNIINAFKYGL